MPHARSAVIALSVAFASAAMPLPRPVVRSDQGKKEKPAADPKVVDGEIGRLLDEAMGSVDVADGGFCGGMPRSIA